METQISSGGRTYPAHLRLVWSNPHPPVPRRPVRLDLAIERHISGEDGLSEREFLRVYSSRP
jgi:hypothetical protein